MVPHREGGDSSVCVGTRYMLGRPGIETRWGQDFPHLFRASLRPTPPPVNGYQVPFPGVKRPGRGVDHPPHLTPRLKEEYSYIYLLPFWAFMARSGMNIVLLVPRRKHSA